MPVSSYTRATLHTAITVGTSAIYSLQMNPGEYDMAFDGAALRTARVLSISSGRYASADSAWTMVYPTAIVQQLTLRRKNYLNIPTFPGGASIGSELPEFMVPNMVARPEGTGSSVLQ